MLVRHETLIQYFKDQLIPKDLANKRKKHSKYLVGPAIEVEVPPVTGCTTAVISNIKRKIFKSNFNYPDLLGSVYIVTVTKKVSYILRTHL